MKNQLIFLPTDLRLAWRDASVRIFLFLPLVFLLLLHVALPALLAAYPVVRPYGPHLLTGIVLQGGLMFSFVAGFLLLDEKDEQVIVVYQVSPLSMYGLLFRRMLLPFLMTLAYVLVALAWNPVHEFRGWALLLTALPFALVTPMGGLLVAGLARNKVEGMAWFKGIDLLMIVPALAFFVPAPWDKVFYVFPTYYVFAAGIVGCGDAVGEGLMYGAVGLVYVGLVIGMSARVFVRRL